MTSGVSITMQSATQIAPRRYFVRLSQRRASAARSRRRTRDREACSPLSLESSGPRHQPKLRRESISCATVQVSTMIARIVESAAP